MELVVLCSFVVLPHEILVLNDVWVNQILRYSELSEHLPESLISKLGVVVDLPHLINELPSHPLDLALVHIGLCSSPQVLDLLDVEGLPVILARAREDLDAFF